MEQKVEKTDKLGIFIIIGSIVLVIVFGLGVFIGSQSPGSNVKTNYLNIEVEFRKNISKEVQTKAESILMDFSLILSETMVWSDQIEHNTYQLSMLDDLLKLTDKALQKRMDEYRKIPKKSKRGF